MQVVYKTTLIQKKNLKYFFFCEGPPIYALYFLEVVNFIFKIHSLSICEFVANLDQEDFGMCKSSKIAFNYKYDRLETHFVQIS